MPPPDGREQICQDLPSNLTVERQSNDQGRDSAPRRNPSYLGLIVFVAAQVLVALGVIVALSLTNGWAATGQFFITLTVPALIGLLAVLAAAMGLGGFTTLRRVTI